MQPLEPRVLLDAAAAKTVQEAAQTPPPASADQAPDNHAALVDALTAVQQEANAPQASAEAARTEVYFIDRQVADADRLAQSLPAGAEVHFIESNVDGVQFIAQTLQGRTDIDAVHILSHGEPGEADLGTARLTGLSMLETYRDTLKQIGSALSVDADILLYGCDFGAGPAGSSAVQVLSQLTGADVAASDDNTGAARLGGDWTLEVRQGDIETAAVQAAQWDYLMAPPEVDLDTGTAGTGSTASYTEGDAPVAIAPAASLTDPDGGNMASMTVRITNGQAGDVLSVSGSPPLPAGMTSAYNPTTFTLTISGAANAAAYQSALQAIRYNSDTQNPGSTARTIDVTVNDGTATSTVATAVVAVTPVNDLPAVDLNSGTTAGANRVVNGNFGGTSGNTNGWTVTGTSFGTNNTGVYGFASTTFVSISQDITGWDQGTAPSGAARLSFLYRWGNFSGNPPGTVTLEVTIGGVLYARFSGSPGAGTNSTVEYFNGASGPAGPLPALPTVNSIDIDLPAGIASTGALAFTYRAPTASSDPITIGSVAVNAPPVDAASGTGFTNSYTENGAGVAIADTDMSITDADNTTLQSATIVLSNAQAGDVLTVGTLPAGITSSIDSSVAGQIKVTLTGSSTLANYVTAIRAVTFSNSTNSPDTTPRVITTTVDDGAISSAAATTTINVTAVNDAPVLANTDLAIAQNEDGGAPSGAVGVLVSTLTGGVTDGDVADARGIAITAASTTSGSWWYSLDNGATWLALGAVSGTNSRLLAADAQTRLYFQPNANFNGSIASALTIRAWDGTNGLANGSLASTATNGGTSAYSVATDTVTVNVAPVNDAPTMTTTAFSASSITEDLSQSTPVGDPNAPPARAGVALTSFATTTTDIDTGVAATGYAIVGADNTNGQWWFSLDSGATWTAMTNLSDANAVLLTRVATARVFFQPNADWNGTATLTVRAWDGTQGTAGQFFDITAAGGTGGTSAFSSTTAVGTHTVTAVVDIAADTLNGANAASEDTPKVFNPITAVGGGTADSFEGVATAQITAIAGQAIAPGGSVAVPNGTVTLDADGQTLTFLGAQDFSGSSVFSYTVTSGGVTETANITVTVTAVAEPPVIDLNGSAAGTDYTGTIDQDRVPIGNGITVTDPENNNLNSMTVTLVNATAADLLYLSAPITGITALYNPATGVLTLTGNATLASYEAALAGVMFSTTSGSTAPRTITVQATSTVAPTASNIAVATITPIDTDGDGVANAGDIDDDNDGLIDDVENQAGLPPPILETTMEGAADVAWTENTNTASLNSTVVGTGWTSWAGTADTWMGSFSLEGSGRWGGTNNGVPGAAEGQVFMSVYSGPALQEAVRLQIPASAGVQVGDVIRIDFQQIFGGVNGSTAVNLPANFVFTIDGVAFNAATLFYNGNNLKEWSPGQITFTATTTQPVITLSIARPSGGEAYLGIDAVRIYNLTNASDAQDPDGDGIVNRLDLDSENDGIPDNVEAQATAGYLPPSGQSAAMVDVDRDGLDDRYDANVGDTTAAASQGLTPVDTDGDGTVDWLDADSDADGRPDIVERGDGQPTSVTSLADADGDGLLDIFEHGTPNDGYYVHDGLVTTSGTGLTTSVVSFNMADTDADTQPDGSNAVPLTTNFDWRDVDPIVARPPAIDLNSIEGQGDGTRDFGTTYESGNAAVNVAATDADVSEFGENDITQATIAVGGVADGNNEVVNVGGSDFQLATDSTQTVTVGGTSFLVSYTVAGGFVITNAGGGVMPQGALDALVRGITYRNALAAGAITAGARTLTFVVTDSSALASTPAVATIQVNRPNNPPVLSDPPGGNPPGQTFDPATGTYSASTTEDVAFTGQVAGTDADGETLTYALGTGPSNGTVTVDPATGGYVYTPNADFNGTDSFTIIISDGTTPTQATVNMTVTPVADIADDTATTPEDTPVVINANGNDSFENTGHVVSAIDGSAITAGTPVAVANGTVTLNADGTLTFTPTTSFSGTSTFTYTVTSGGVTETATVTVNVTPVDAPPVLSDPPGGNPPGQTFDPATGTYSAGTTEDVAFTGQVSGTDVDSSTLTYALGTGPANGTVTVDPATGAYVYTPTGDFNGSDSFTISISDGTTTIQATVNMTVTPVADIADDTATTPEDTPVVINVNANDTFENGAHAITSIDGTAVTVGTPLAVANGSVTLNADGTLTFTPATNFYGSAFFTYTVSSGGVTETATVTVTVTPVNDTPTFSEPPGGNPPGQTFDPPPSIYSATTTEDVPFAGQVAGLDVDGDPLTYAYTLATGPTNGTVAVDPATGAYVYTPNADFNGTDTFTVTISDGTVTVQGTVNMTVTPVADIADDTATTPEDTPVVINVNGNDSFENAAHVVSAINGGAIVVGTPVAVANGSVTLNADGALTFTPTTGFSGPSTFTYTVTSGGVTETATVTVNVTPVNDPPVPGEPPGGNPPGQTFDPATGTYSASTTEDAAFTGQVAGTDADGDTLTYALGTGPTNGTVTVDPATGGYVYTPNGDFNGTDSFVITISDGTVTIQATVNMTVTPAADIADDTATTPEDTPVVIDLNANDSFENAGHVVSAINGGAIAAGTPVAVANGSVTLNADGTLAFTPNANFNGATSFTYTVTSGGVTETATVTVNVTPVNDPPVPGEPPGGNPPGQTFDPATGTYSAATTEDVAFTGQVGGADVDGDTLTYALGTGPANGTVAVDPATGGYVYTPNADFNGTDSFTITISDGTTTIQATVSMTVTPVADAVDDNVSTNRNVPITFNVLSGTNGASADSFENAGAAVTAVTQGAGGTVTLAADGTLVYTPNPGFRGVDTFTYTVTSGGVTETATVTVSVVPFNIPPVPGEPPGGNPPGQTFDPATGAYAASTTEDAAFTGQVAGTDADGDLLTYVLVGGPANGTVTVDPATGGYVYTPNGDFNGSDSFVIEIRDEYGGAVQARVNMAVTSVADIADDTATTPEGTPVVINVNANDSFENAGHIVSAIDGGAITVGTPVAVANGSVTLNADGTLRFTPNPNFNGTSSFTYTVTSGGVTETATVVVNVLHVNAPPAAADPGDVPGQDFDPSTGNYHITTPQDTAFPGRVGSADADGDPILHELQTPPANGSVVVQPDGRYVYTPKPGYVGTDSFVVRMSDGQGGFVTSTVFIDVTPVTQPAAARDDFPFVFQPQAQPREFVDTNFETLHINVEPTVVQAVNSARSLGGTRELTAVSGVVLQAANGVDSLNGTAILGENGAVLQAVNSVDPLYGSASYDRLDTAMERQLLSMDAAGHWAEEVSSLHLGDGLSVEFTAGRQQVSLALSSGEPVREVRATLADGRPLPSWMHMDSRGFLLMDRPAGVEQVRLRLTVIKQSGAALTRTIEIDFNSGELKQIPARSGGTRAGMDAGDGGGATALASIPALDFVAQLERAAERTSEADAQLFQALEEAG